MGMFDESDFMCDFDDFNQGYFDDTDHEDYLYCLDAKMWKTKDDKFLSMSEITDGHLENIYRHLRKRKELMQWPHIREEFRKRGLSIKPTAGLSGK